MTATLLVQNRARERERQARLIRCHSRAWPNPEQIYRIANESDTHVVNVHAIVPPGTTDHTETIIVHTLAAGAEVVFRIRAAQDCDNTLLGISFSDADGVVWIKTIGSGRLRRVPSDGRRWRHALETYSILEILAKMADPRDREIIPPVLSMQFVCNEIAHHRLHWRLRSRERTDRQARSRAPSKRDEK